MNELQIVAYIVTIIPSVYFLYRILREAYYYLNRDDSDVLEG
ncbi:MAG TPA: hypothetical protein VGB32_09070 [Candidatus Bathyarchaeia archaeon]|jgi:hypothetical protein